MPGRYRSKAEHSRKYPPKPEQIVILPPVVKPSYSGTTPVTPSIPKPVQSRVKTVKQRTSPFRGGVKTVKQRKRWKNTWRGG